MRKIALLLTVALAVPAAAMAAHKPSHPKPAAPAPKVQFIAKGTVLAYTAATSTTAGSIKLRITGGNSISKKLFAVGAEPTYTLTAATKIVSPGIANGDTVLVKVRAAKNASAATVSAGPAWQVVETS